MAAARRIPARTANRFRNGSRPVVRPFVQTYLESDLRQLSAVSSLPDFQARDDAGRATNRQTPQPSRLGPRRDAQSPDDAPVFEAVGNWLSGYTHPPGGDQSLGRTRQGPEVALDRLWSCGLARRDQVVRRRHATLGCWFLLGANPVSDSEHVACPPFTTPPAPFFSDPRR